LPHRGNKEKKTIKNSFNYKRLLYFVFLDHGLEGIDHGLEIPADDIPAEALADESTHHPAMMMLTFLLLLMTRKSNLQGKKGQSHWTQPRATRTMRYYLIFFLLLLTICLAAVRSAIERKSTTKKECAGESPRC